MRAQTASVQAVVAGRRDDFTFLEAGRQHVKLRQPARNSSDVVCVTAAGASWSRLPTPEPMALDGTVIGRRVATTSYNDALRGEFDEECGLSETDVED